MFSLFFSFLLVPTLKALTQIGSIFIAVSKAELDAIMNTLRDKNVAKSANSREGEKITAEVNYDATTHAESEDGSAICVTLFFVCVPSHPFCCFPLASDDPACNHLHIFKFKFGPS